MSNLRTEFVTLTLSKATVLCVLGTLRAAREMAKDGARQEIDKEIWAIEAALPVNALDPLATQTAARLNSCEDCGCVGFSAAIVSCSCSCHPLT